MAATRQPPPRQTNSPLGCLLVFVVAAIGLGVLPLLLWIQTTFTLSTLGVVLNQEHYSRATFQITEYGRYAESGPGPDVDIQHYFYGTVNGTPHTMGVGWARYAPELARIMDTAPDGRTPVNLAVGVWYNPQMRSSLLAREQILLPDAPGLFEAMHARLRSYGLLWLVFIGYWGALGLYVRTAERRRRVKD